MTGIFDFVSKLLLYVRNYLFYGAIEFDPLAAHVKFT